LTGAKANYQAGAVQAELFAAEVEDARSSVEIPGNGTALLFRIEDAPLVRNSEVIELITRSRNNQGLVIESRILERFVDYSIDFISGDIRFVSVIPSVDADLNPISLRISYDVKGTGDEELVVGARASVNLTKDVTLSGAYTQDDNDDLGFELLGAMFEVDLSDSIQWVVSAATLDHNNSANEDGDAFYSSFYKQWKNGSRSSITWGRADAGFTNSGPVSADREELKVNHTHQLTESLSLDAEVLSSEMLSTDDRNQSMRLSTRYGTGAWDLNLGARWLEQERETDNGIESTTANTLIAGAQRQVKISNQLINISAEYEREVGGQNLERWAARTSAPINDKLSVYGTVEKINSLSGITEFDSDVDRINVTLGLDSNFLPSTTLYNEYRLRGVVDGRQLEAAAGVRGDYTLTEGIKISPSFEVIETMDGDDNADAVAFSVGLSDIRSKNSRTLGRFETRFTEEEDYYGIDLSHVRRISADWSAFIREQLRFNDNSNASDTTDHVLTLALAKRSKKKNDHHLLSLYRWKEERGTDVLSDRTVHEFSLHQNYQFSDNVLMSSRLGAKYETLSLSSGQNLSSRAAIMDTRLTWDINRRYDLDLHGGVLGTNDFDEIRYSLGAGMNVNLKKNIRLGVGYNFIGFEDRDLDEQGLNRQGFYIQALYKFDEQLFGWLESKDGSQ